MAPGNALTPQLIAPRPDAAVPQPRPRSNELRRDDPRRDDLRRFAFELPARPESVARARRLVRDRLLLWGIEGAARDATELVVSELLTNAVVHTASGRVVCELRDRGEQLRIAVHDEGRPAQVPRPAEAEECGRGLLIVDAVCSAWGAHDARHGAGRVVWAELVHDVAEPC